MKQRLPFLCSALFAAGCSQVTDGRSFKSDVPPVEALRVLEQQIEDAVSRRDHRFLDSVTAPSFTRTDQEGKVEDRARVMALIRQPPPTSDIIRRTIDPSKQQVQLHGDVAVTRGELEVRGPRRAFRTTYSRVYRWRSGRWQLLSNTTLSTTPLEP